VNLVAQILYSLWFLGAGGGDGVSLESDSTMRVELVEHQPMVVTEESVASAIKTLQGNRSITSAGLAALALLKQAANMGNGLAAKEVGDAYVYGYSTTVDYTEGVRWYRLAGESGNADGWHNLAYMIGGGWVEGREKAEAAEYYLRAHAMGNRYSKRQFAHRIIHGTISDFSPEYGLQLYHELLDEGHYSILANLRQIYREGTKSLAPNPEKLEEMEKLREELIKRFRAEGRSAMQEVVAIYEASGESAALDRLTQLAAPYIQDSFAGFQFYVPVWGEAQTLAGRRDQEFALSIYNWLRDYIDRHDATSINRIRVRHNLATSQISTGRIASLSQNIREIESLVLSQHGLDISAMLNAAAHDKVSFKFPSVVTDFEFNATSRPYRKVRVGDPFPVEVPIALRAIAEERIWNGRLHEGLRIAQWLNQTGTFQDRDSIGNGRNLLGVIYSILGEYEKASEVYQQNIADEWTAYRGRQWHSAATELYLLFVEGKVFMRPEIDLDSLEELRANNRLDRRYGAYEVQLVRLIEEVDLQQDQWVVPFTRLIEYAMEENMTYFAQRVRLAIIHVVLSRGIVDEQLEAIFLEALLASREMGAKIQEPFLYRDYARFLAALGRLGEAVELMRMARDLFSMWDLNLRQLETELYLTEFLYRTNQINRKDLLAMSQSAAFEHVPAWLQQQAAKLAAVSAAAVDAPETQSMVLSPEHITIAPVSEYGAQAIFTLTNPSPGPAMGTLHLSGVHAADSLPEGLVLVEANASGDPGRQSDLTKEWSLGPWEQGFIVIATDLADTSSYQVELRVQARDCTTTSSSTLEVQPGSHGQMRSFISAHLIRDNPFFASPVFHILQGTDAGEENIAFRLVASAPCRIEAYDKKGELIFVDANGDGRLDGRGDLLPYEPVGDGVARVHLTEGETAQLIEIRYFPQESSFNEPIEIRIERYVSGVWQMQAIDIIEPVPKAKVIGEQFVASQKKGRKQIKNLDSPHKGPL
jgi:hypothetical protein